MYSMVKIDVFVHHRGYFAHPPNGTIQYVGGDVDRVMEDTDTMCFADLEDYSVAFDYYRGNSLVYFQCDGHSFEKNVRVLYDDASMKEMIEVCQPFGSIHLFVDHFDLEHLQDLAAEKENSNNPEYEWSEGSNDDDPEFDIENEDESDSENNHELMSDESDPELIANVREMKIRKAAAANKKNAELRKFFLKSRDDENEQSDYLSDEMRSLSSSSEDETFNKVYIRLPLSKKKKKKCIL